MTENIINKIPIREEVEDTLKWKLENIFSSNEQWEKEFEEVSLLLNKATSFQGTIKEDAVALLEVLRYKDEVFYRIGKLYAFARMRHDQDTENGTFQAMESRSLSLQVKVFTELSFIEPEILSLDVSRIEAYLNENGDLGLYKQHLEEINKKRPHILSRDQEALLANFSQVAGASENTFSKLNEADLEFPSIIDENGKEVQLTQGRYNRFIESEDRRVREDAYKALFNTYKKFRNTFASTLSGNVKSNNVKALVRNYTSAREAALSENHIPETVYDNLVGTVNENLHLLHKYVGLRKKILGVDELHMWDINAPLVKEANMKFTYEEACNIMLESFEPLGKEYVSIVKKGLENGWVDVVETKGKRSGAYSAGIYGIHPYILMNWQDDVNNLFTLAHEFGHSLHSYYTGANQPFVYGDYTTFVAEVASTCNEALLSDHLLKITTDPQKRIYLLNHWLETLRGTIFRQTLFAEFEHTIHKMDQEGEALTADKLTEIYSNLNKKYFGDDLVIEEEGCMEWARIPHFYYNFYLYQYATGMVAAGALSNQILSEGKPAVERYINNFLKSGCSNYPIEVLKQAGVDMNTASPIEEVLRVFEEKLNELAELLS